MIAPLLAAAASGVRAIGETVAVIADAVRPDPGAAQIRALARADQRAARTFAELRRDADELRRRRDRYRDRERRARTPAARLHWHDRAVSTDETLAAVEREAEDRGGLSS